MFIFILDKCIIKIVGTSFWFSLLQKPRSIISLMQKKTSLIILVESSDYLPLEILTQLDRSSDG